MSFAVLPRSSFHYPRTALPPSCRKLLRGSVIAGILGIQVAMLVVAGYVMFNFFTMLDLQCAYLTPKSYCCFVPVVQMGAIQVPVGNIVFAVLTSHDLEEKEIIIIFFFFFFFLGGGGGVGGTSLILLRLVNVGLHNHDTGNQVLEFLRRTFIHACKVDSKTAKHQLVLTPRQQIINSS